MNPAVFLLPLAAGLLYGLASMFLKQGLQNGAGMVRSVFFSNLITAACFLPALAFNQEAIRWSAIGWPILAGLCYFGGQGFTVWAIKAGDVSVQTPLMGTKVVFVAVFTMILQPDPIPLVMWVAAGITAIAVFLLGQSNEVNVHAVRKAVVLAITSCVFFGATDSLVAARAPEFGRIPMMMGMMITLCTCSLALLPLAEKPLLQFPAGALRPMCIGSVFIGLQALLLNIALGFFGHATAINVVYSTRGLFGILLVWFVGSHFANREREEAGARLMRFRLAGALLLMCAIGLVFV